MRLDHLLSKELNYCLVGHAARECRVGGLLMGGMSAPFFLLFVLFHGVVYTSSLLLCCSGAFLGFRVAR